MKSQRVGVLLGGTSAEREVSLRTGAAVAEALGSRGHEVVLLDLAHPDVFSQLAGARLDTAFLALHGRFGEDGCVQGVLEMLRIPYTGSDVLSSALAMDKLKSKELFRLHNVPTPPYYVWEAPDTVGLLDAHGAFGYPAVVKPRREGSSIGLSIVKDSAQLLGAVASAQAFDRCILVERFIRAKEVTVGILDGRVLGVLEIAPKSGVYDYNAKYTPNQTEYFIPARLTEQRTIGVLNLAERAAEALGVTGAIRIDLLVTEGQNEYVLEANTLPGMTPTSLLPKIAAAAGYSFGDLCEAILAGARLHAGGVETQAEAASAAPASEEVVPLPVAV